MSARSLMHRLRKETRGATIVEFGFVLIPLCVMLLGTLDLGYRIYMLSVVQGVLHDAARKATVGDINSSTVDTFVRSQLVGFKNANVSSTQSSYGTFSNVSTLEDIKSDTAPFGVYNKGSISGGVITTGDCYEDVNDNWKRDDRGKTGLGAADDVVLYTVTVNFTRLVPLQGLLGWSDQESVSAKTVLRNQPYAANAGAIPPVRCYEK